MDKTDKENLFRKTYEKREPLELILASLNTGLALINPDLTVAWVNEVTLGILPLKK